MPYRSFLAKKKLSPSSLSTVHFHEYWVEEVVDPLEGVLNKALHAPSLPSNPWTNQRLCPGAHHVPATMAEMKLGTHLVRFQSKTS